MVEITIVKQKAFSVLKKLKLMKLTKEQKEYMSLI